MPHDYRCDRCGLEITVGQHPYDDLSSGYGSATLLVCRSCGAQHRVRTALRPEILESIRRSGDRCSVVLVSPGEHRPETMATLRKLLGCPISDARVLVDSAPATIGTGLSLENGGRLQEELQAAGAEVTVSVSRGAVPVNVPAQARDELQVARATGRAREWEPCQLKGARRGPAGEFELQEQGCASCGAVGTLISELPGNSVLCPKCGAGALVPA